ncbi:hypothetical protein N9H30_00260 [bacterium]|nr:hypothetical protein [bacterium]|tara:strand:- start:1431 stop:1703 length:273 start_codon:yes stop_codon:yes gene_type:complete
MKNSIPSLWDKRELLDIYGRTNPTLEERTDILLSYWHGFKYKASINNKTTAYTFLKKKRLKENKAQIRGKEIGFANSVHLAEFLLKNKNV